MHRTDADGNDGGLYTEGDAGLGIPATVVSSAAANSWQEELANLVETAGLALLTSGTDTFDQVQDAIRILIENGGAIAPITDSIANNSSNVDLDDGGSPITADRTEVRSVKYDYYIHRKTDSNEVAQTGTLYIIYKPESATWDISWESNFDDAGVTFNLASVDADTQKIQYSSDDLTGTTYVGEIRLSNKKEIRV